MKITVRSGKELGLIWKYGQRDGKKDRGERLRADTIPNPFRRGGRMGFGKGELKLALE